MDSKVHFVNEASKNQNKNTQKYHLNLKDLNQQHHLKKKIFQRYKKNRRKIAHSLDIYQDENEQFLKKINQSLFNINEFDLKKERERETKQHRRISFNAKRNKLFRKMTNFQPDLRINSGKNLNKDEKIE